MISSADEIKVWQYKNVGGQEPSELKLTGHTNEYIEELDRNNQIKAIYFIDGNDGEKDKYLVTFSESETIFWDINNKYKLVAKIESRVIPAEGFNQRLRGVIINNKIIKCSEELLA